MVCKESRPFKGFTRTLALRQIIFVVYPNQRVRRSGLNSWGELSKNLHAPVLENEPQLGFQEFQRKEAMEEDGKDGQEEVEGGKEDHHVHDGFVEKVVSQSPLELEVGEEKDAD